MFKRMYDGFKAAVKQVRLATLALIAGVGALLAGSPVLADAGPPSMPEVTFPVNPASVGTAISVAGGTILLIVFGVSISFYLAWKLFRRIRRAV